MESPQQLVMDTVKLNIIYFVVIFIYIIFFFLKFSWFNFCFFFFREQIQCKAKPDWILNFSMLFWGALKQNVERLYWKNVQYEVGYLETHQYQSTNRRLFNIQQPPNNNIHQKSHVLQK